MMNISHVCLKANSQMLEVLVQRVKTLLKLLVHVAKMPSQEQKHCGKKKTCPWRALSFTRHMTCPENSSHPPWFLQCLEIFKVQIVFVHWGKLIHIYITYAKRIIIFPTLNNGSSILRFWGYCMAAWNIHLCQCPLHPLMKAQRRSWKIMEDKAERMWEKSC